MWDKIERILHHAGHNFTHSLEHTLPLLPFIFLIYAAIELIEAKADMQKVGKLGSRLGPLVGSATGLVPQCGFSVMAAKLFEQKYITVGTLFAIFTSTSDEAFIIMLSSGDGAAWVVPMLLAKIGIGIIVGYSVDLCLKAFGRRQVCVQMPKTVNGLPETTHEIFMQAYLEERDVETNCSCGRKHDGDSAWKNYLLYPLLHALKVGLFIFLVNFALEIVIHEIGGEEVFARAMKRNRFIQPFITCAVGLIPNCASSVVITEGFLSGAITFGSCVAGLCVNAGMGFVVLLRNTRKWKRNVSFILLSYLIAVCIGLAFNLIAPVFV
jgi:hypothetical protein